MAAPPPAQAPQALMDEIVEEFLLRLPPAEPASLVRAALVCKPWCRLISSPRFRRRFREFHRTPPMLGFICNTRRRGIAPYVARFVTSTSSSFRPPHADHRNCFVLDARHGYVLLDSGHRFLVVWDPVTDKRWQLPPLVPVPKGWNGSVLCAASGASNHFDCLHGTFIVVLIGFDLRQTTLRVYSSESGSWSQQTVVYRCAVDLMPAVLVGNTIYFSIDMNFGILSYDLAARDTSVICVPPHSAYIAAALMTMEDDVLGVARTDGARLSLWSMETSPNGDIGWAQIRVIELAKLLPVNAFPICSTFIVFAPGTGVLFIHGDNGLFTIDLKSEQVKKVLDRDDENYVLNVVPYMSFYTPALGSTTTDEGPGVDVSSA